MDKNSSLLKDQGCPSKYPTKSDGYGNFIIYMPNEPINTENCERLNDCSNLSISLEVRASGVLMEKRFFSNFCTTRIDGMKKLSLRGSDLLSKIGRRLKDIDVPELLLFLRENPQVVELSLDYNEIRCVGFVNIINHIANEKRVTKLNVQNNEIRSRGIEHLCELAEELELETLGLNGNKFGAESSRQLALLLLRNRHLKRLDIAEVDQTAASLVAILRSENNTLKVLDISRPNPGCMYYFDSDHFSSLIGSMLRNNKCLEQLYLRKFGCSCHDIECMLTEGRHNRTLLLLDLGSNNVADFGTELIANWLKQRPALSALVLAHNIITSTGARALSYAVPASKIRHLDVSCNRIGDSGINDILNSLKKNPPIESLRIFGNSIGHDTAKIINRMLLSGVLVRQYLDVKPYKVDREWFCARYPADSYQVELN